MSRTHRPTLLALLAVLALFVFGTSAQGFASRESFCSKENTASNRVYTWDYQSNGNCTGHCAQEGGPWAFAVIKYTDCYCSNYIPQDQLDVSECQVPCPGYPAEHCGSFDNDNYIYIKMPGAPSGTAGAGGTPVPASSTTVQPSPSPRPSSSQTSRPQSELSTSVQVVTQSGIIITRTVVQTPTAVPSSSSVPARPDNGNSGPNVGAIVGGVVGGILGLLAIIGGILFFLWRRRQQQRDAEKADAASGITRNTSTMSKAGLLGGANEIGLQQSTVGSNYGSQYSRYGADGASTSPTSVRRNSRGAGQLIVDSRMDPETYIEHAHANHSRESVGTIDDTRDYARKLGVRNPDP